MALAPADKDGVVTVHPALPTGAFSVVRLPDEVDLGNSSAVLDSMLSTINRGGGHLVVDALDVGFMDSSCMHALVRARERTEARNGSFHLVAASRRLRRLLQVTRLERTLRRVDTVEEAVTCITSSSPLHVCGGLQPPV